MGRQPNRVVRCPTCEKYITGSEHGVFTIEEPPYSHVNVRHGLLSCPDCHGPFLVRHDGLDEQDEFGGPDYIEWEEPKMLYPGVPDSLDVSVPPNIAASYLEARRSFSQASAYTGAAILCRRTLEGICDDRGANGRNLKDKAIIMTLRVRGSGRVCLFSEPLDG